MNWSNEAHAGDSHLEIWDWWFYTNRLLKTEFAVDDFAVAEYFPLEAVIDGLFMVTQSLLGIRYEPAPDAPRWHDDVQAFDIYDADGTEPFARFYMDLFPRPNKFNHAAAFTLRGGRRLPDGSLTMVYLLHPDPWPKARHAKRRMMNDGPLALIAAKMKPGGEFRVATDDPTYLDWLLMVMQRHTEDFEWVVTAPGEWLSYPSGWPETRYAAKARRQGRVPHQFRYRRLGGADARA